MVVSKKSAIFVIEKENNIKQHNIMKHIITLLAIAFATLFSNNVYGQENHMTFKGISISGHVDDFVQKLEDMGYTYEETTEYGSIIMSGPFADYKSVKITLITTAKSNTVWRVIVTVESRADFEYDYLKKKYEKKYGDNYKKENYGSDIPYYIWNFDNGKIFIHMERTIESLGTSIPFYDLEVYYDDEVGGNLSIQEKEEMINNDI